MKIEIIFLFFLILLQFYSLTSVAEIFKWTDEHGRTHYSEKPPEDAQTDKVGIKNLNTIKQLKADEKEGTYKKDFFVMPARKSSVPYRFTLASKLSGKSPGDRLKEFNAQKDKMTFYIHVSMPGVDSFQEYKYRSRIIDAKGELVFDKTVAYTPTKGSMFMVNNYTIKPHTDEPGKWTFQGLLDGKKLFIEKRNINFSTPKKDKNTSSTQPLDRTIQLPDGSVLKAPETKEEIEAIHKKIISRVKTVTKKKPLANIKQKKTISKVTDKFLENEVTCSNKLSVGCSEYTPIIQEYSPVNFKFSTQSEINIEKPTAASLFDECDTKKLKPGTNRSSLCDLWGEHLLYLQGRMAKECSAAGEKIYKTALNVEGVFVNHPQYDKENPKRSFKSNILHSARSVSPLSGYSAPSVARLYRSHEVYSSRDKGYLTTRITGISKGIRVAKIDKDRSVNQEPQSRFEVSYEHLTTNEDHAQGFYGDRTWIKDRKTDELMAERIIYFYYINKTTKMQDGASLKRVSKHNNGKRYYYPCDNYVPRLSQFELEHEQKHPRNEYEFVSRVLQPVPFTQEENNLMYDFSIGNGRKVKDCVGMQKVGPKITPSNLVVERVKDDLKLSVKNQNDSFTCTRFFIGPHSDIKLLFADGGLWQEKMVLKHGNIEWRKGE